MGFSEEVELMEMGYLLLGNGSLVGEAEIVEGLDLWEPGGPHPMLSTVGLPRCHLLA